MEIELYHIRNGKKIVKQEILDLYLKNNLIVDGAKGGLICGRSHKEGGIYVIHLNSDQDCELTFEIEGFEYLVNPFGSESNLTLLTSINKKHSGEIHTFKKYEIPPNIQILDLTMKMIDGKEFQPIILFSKGPQQVVNKLSTQKYLQEIDQINKRTWLEATSN